MLSLGLYEHQHTVHIPTNGHIGIRMIKNKKINIKKEIKTNTLEYQPRG